MMRFAPQIFIDWKYFYTSSDQKIGETYHF